MTNGPHTVGSPPNRASGSQDARREATTDRHALCGLHIQRQYIGNGSADGLIAQINNATLTENFLRSSCTGLGGGSWLVQIFFLP
jgi:hypothetical protein